MNPPLLSRVETNSRMATVPKPSSFAADSLDLDLHLGAARPARSDPDQLTDQVQPGKVLVDPASRFPDVSLSACMPVGQCYAARPAGRRALSGARRPTEAGSAGREGVAGQGSGMS